MDMTDSAAFALHRPNLAQNLSAGDDKLRKLMAASVRVVSSGSTLIESDSIHDYVYRLRTGWVARVRTLEDGRAQFILIFLPGDLFAVKSMFVTHHPDAVHALSDAVVEQIDYRRLKEAYDRDPDIALRCTWQIVEEERRLHNWVVGLGRGSAEERLSLLFLDFRARLVLSGTLPDGALSFEVPMTQEQIADHVGLSTVHVNRVLRNLRELGVATLRGKTVTIQNEKALRRLSYPLLDSFERCSSKFGRSPEGAEGS
ncbi:MAG: crp [Xanthobacteraceae bacterium]|jgi:CRP/FNR family transcriptional regulator|nr:crp [Xanthobacteraceae bacterium]